MLVFLPLWECSTLAFSFPLKGERFGYELLLQCCPGISSGTEAQSGKTSTAVERPRYCPVMSPSLHWIYTAVVAIGPEYGQ